MKEKFRFFIKNSGEQLFYFFIFLTPILAPSPLIRFGPRFWRLRYGEVYLVVLVICFIFLIFKIILGRPIITWLKDKRRLFFIFLALFVMVNGLSLARFYGFLPGSDKAANFFNPSTSFGYSTVRYIFLVAGFLLVFLPVGFLTSYEKLKRAWKVFIVSADLACLFGFYILGKYLLKLGYYPVQKHVARSWIWPRLIGTALEPQTFASLLLSVIFLTLAFYLFEKRRWPRFFYLASFWLQLAALGATFSLGGLLSFTIGLGLLILLLLFMGEAEWKKKILVLFGSIVLVAGLILQVSPDSREAIFSLWLKTRPPAEFTDWRVKTVRRNPAAYTVLDRAVSREVAGAMFLKRPILGWGTGSFGYRYEEFKKPDQFLKHYQRPRSHNQYLEILAESGLLGLTFFLAGIGFLFWFLFQRLTAVTNGSKIFLLVQVATLVAFLVHGGSFSFFPHLYFWLFLGFILSPE